MVAIIMMMKMKFVAMEVMENTMSTIVQVSNVKMLIGKQNKKENQIIVILIPLTVRIKTMHELPLSKMKMPKIMIMMKTGMKMIIPIPVTIERQTDKIRGKMIAI
jgi:hypothetical protein